MRKKEDPPPRHVLPHPDGGWQEKKEGNERASHRYETKAEAIKDTIQHARDEGGRAIIHGQDNLIQEERTYRKDPYLPRG